MNRKLDTKPKLVGISACVDYTDFLSVSWSHNKYIFHKYYVVTTDKDLKTHEFCRKNGINCVISDKFYFNGAKFDRGRALNDVFKLLPDNTEWVLHLDADTIIPYQILDVLPSLNKEFFYGANRDVLKTYEDYLAWKNNRDLSTCEARIDFCCGFFQLFNWQSSVIKNHDKNQLIYPSNVNCAQSDWMFYAKWGGPIQNTNYTKWYGKIGKLPFRVINLGEHGKDHNGRVQKEFL